MQPEAGAIAVVVLNSEHIAGSLMLLRPVMSTLTPILHTCEGGLS